MSVYKQHKQISDMIETEATRLDFSPVMLNDLACILFGKPRHKLTLPQAKMLLIELQTMGDDGLHLDSPLAKYLNRGDK